ncbi:MAG: DUF4416 family protein [Nanoarchaeota archaeon]
MSNLIIAIMYSDNGTYVKVKSILIEKYGLIKKETEPYDFDKFTSYYEKEMGKGIIKRFLIFDKEIEKNDLVKIKHETTEVEKEFSIDNKRTINLDPGYLNNKELVLASFKKGTNYKEDMGQGVYAHKVLEFNGEIKTFWHTFPDYKEHKELFTYP